MPAKQSTAESAFKNWINEDVVKKMARSLVKVAPGFNTRKFLEVSRELAPLELKARVRLLRQKLRELLPQNYPEALAILMQSMRDDTLKGFALWPYADFIENYGLEHRDLSLKALYELTQRFTSEFAVRPYIQKYPRETLKQLEKWATDSNYHVRRWVSEGTRPRLPWGLRLQELVRDPSPTIPLLEKLKYDSELYVRKSVANHLNDISKDHPEKVVALLKKWVEEAPQVHRAKIQWIVRHALRSLLKAGDPKALKLLGYGPQAKVKVSSLHLKKKTVRIGENLEFAFEVKCGQKSGGCPQSLMIDYVIYHRKANGNLSPKVFKLRTVKLPPKGSVKVEKKHSFKPVTTRVYYPGSHAIEIQINGQKYVRAEFKLTK